MGRKINLAGFAAFVILCFLFSAAVHAYPSNAMVKACIMDENYRTVEKTELNVYGTQECIVISIKTNKEILRLPKNEVLNITRADGCYTLKYKICTCADADDTVEPEKETDIETGEQIYKLSSDFKITCPGGVLGIKDFIRGGKPALYRGEFRIIGNTARLSAFYLINYLDVEYYLKGVVPSEMPVYFGLEALKAQAVAARNYSLSPRTKMAVLYDVVDSVASQVYHGYNREDEVSNEAIDETHGLCALYNDEMIVAVFSSTAGGYSESYSNTFSDPVTKEFPSPEKPYLKAKPDMPDVKPLNDEEEAYKFYSTSPVSYDVYSPLYRWTRTWNREEIENVLKISLITQSKTGFVQPKMTNSDDFGTLKSIKVTKRGNSGKIITMEIETDKNTFTVSKELIIRRIFLKDNKPMPSANVVFKYEIDKEGNWSEITAYGGGFGHGSGMSQYGAMYMAQNCNLPFDTILKHYYSGICIGTKPFEFKDKSVPQCFYAYKNSAILVIPDKKDIKTLKVDINGEVVDFNLSNAGGKSRCEIDISPYIKQGELNTVIFTSAERSTHTKKRDKTEPVSMYIKF